MLCLLLPTFCVSMCRLICSCVLFIMLLHVINLSFSLRYYSMVWKYDNLFYLVSLSPVILFQTMLLWTFIMCLLVHLYKNFPRVLVYEQKYYEGEALLQIYCITKNCFRILCASEFYQKSSVNNVRIVCLQTLTITYFDKVFFFSVFCQTWDVCNIIAYSFNLYFPDYN